MAKKSLAGKDVLLWIRSVAFTDDKWKVVVCAIQHTLSRQKSESTTVSKCGSETTPGTDDDSVSLDLTFVISGYVDASELTAATLEAMYTAGDSFTFKIADAYPSALYIDKDGAGVMTALEESYPAEGLVNYAVTIKVNGPITNNL